MRIKNKKQELTTKELHVKAIELYSQGKTINEVKELLSIPHYKANKWRIAFNKWKTKENENQFVREYKSGKYRIAELAKKYNISYRKVLEWKVKHFGYGEQREKMIYKMHVVGIPSNEIALFYDIHIVSVHRSIRNAKQKLKEKEQVYKSYQKKKFVNN